MPFEHPNPSPEDLGVESAAPTNREQPPSDLIEQAFSDLKEEIAKSDRLEAIGNTAELASTFDRVLNRLKEAHAKNAISSAWALQSIDTLQGYFKEFNRDLASMDQNVVNKKAYLPPILDKYVSNFEIALNNISQELTRFGS